MYNPWCGSRYGERRTLLLLESAYTWMEGGVPCRPGPDHPSEIVDDLIAQSSRSPTMLKLNRALCGRADPSPEEARDCWGRVALTEYLPGSMGNGSARPTQSDWLEAEREWPLVLDLLRPRTVVVLGRSMWTQDAPHGRNRECRYSGLCAAGGAIAMCFATFHPSPRVGRDWRFFADFFAWVEIWQRSH